MREYADNLLAKISQNGELISWWRAQEEFCATYRLLEHGIFRLGTITTNSSEQLAGVLDRICELPIFYIITALIGRMSDTCFRRCQQSQKLVAENRSITPYAYFQHDKLVRDASTYHIEPELFQEGNLDCDARSMPFLAPYRVRISSSLF